MWATITKPFAALMLWLYNLTGNYGVSIILFALGVNLILAPFMAKSKKSMMRTSRLQPKIQELQKRHEGNQQKLNAEMQKLYQEEGVNPMSGCIWTLIPFPILIALYSVIRQPITRMMFLAQDVVTALQEHFAPILGEISARDSSYLEIRLADLAHQNWSEVQSALGSRIEGLVDLDFGFLGLNLGEQPVWNFFTKVNWANSEEWLPALGLFLIPFVSAGFSWLSMKVTNLSNPQNDAQAQATSNTMTLMMPLMSIWICFMMPAAMGIYWIATSVFGMVRDFFITKYYKKKLDAEDAVRNEQRRQRELEMEERRLETERLRAEGKTEVNTNTSKKKLQASEKQKQDERKAAAERAERAARRERLGIQEAEIPASQVGNRRYARGRAYVADRYTNPENAEAATLAAAAESEFNDSIDPSVADDIVTAEERNAAIEALEDSIES